MKFWNCANCCECVYFFFFELAIGTLYLYCVALHRRWWWRWWWWHMIIWKLHVLCLVYIIEMACHNLIRYFQIKLQLLLYSACLCQWNCKYIFFFVQTTGILTKYYHITLQIERHSVSNIQTVWTLLVVVFLSKFSINSKEVTLFQHQLDWIILLLLLLCVYFNELNH